MTVEEQASNSPVDIGKVRVLICDDHAIVREALATVIDSSPSFRVVAQTEGFEDTIETLASLDVDVVVLDIRLKGSSGLELARRLRADAPSVRILLLTGYLSDEILLEAEAIGVDGIMDKSSEPELILERLASDILDLSVDTQGNSRQLFTRNLEIFIADTYIDAKHVSSLMTTIDSRLEVIHDYMRQLKEDENVTASRFTGAIASIMLVPTFIVGLYGQNFVNLPETSWRFGYLFSWGVIVLVTVGQVWYFRRRRWI